MRVSYLDILFIAKLALLVWSDFPFYCVSCHCKVVILTFSCVCRSISKLLVIPAYLARKATKLQVELSKETDKRIRVMNETIIGIRVIKMYGLEHVFEKVIKKVRRFIIQY